MSETKRAKDVAYHKENMLLCKQEEAGIQLNAEQADWRDDTDDESEDQELEAHYMYMAQIQEVSLDAADSGPIFDIEPVQKVSNNDNYNVFTIETEHPEQSKSIHDTYPIEQDEHNMIIDSLDMSYDREQINQNDDDNDLTNKQMKNKLSAHQETISILSQAKEAQMKLYKTREDKELDKVIALENKVKRYFHSIKLEVDSFRSQLETQKTQFLNEIERLSREYYYADHMNAILGVYTELDKVTNLQCDYLELLQKFECLEKELSKSKMMSKSFESVQKHAINLELELQQCKEKMKNDKSFKVNQSKEFCKEREQYFEIQDLKDQLHDKGIAISELKKLIEKLKGKSVDTKFEKPLVIRQPNAFKSQRQSILGKPAIFSDSLERKDFSTSKSVSKNNVSNDFSKPVTAQILPPNKKSIFKNTNVLAPGMCTKHMTGNLKLLINFVEKFLGTVKFRNDQIAPILGYGDLGNDLLTGSRETDLYSITLQDTTSSNPICLMAKATSFVQRGHHAQVRIVRTNKGTEFLNQTLHAYFSFEGILHQTSVARTPKQNGVVERRNRTLVEAARKMLSAVKVFIFFWAEAITTVCVTQNRSLVIPRHKKTPYHIINDQKPSVKFFHIFRSLCYIVRDGENLDKMKEKGDACIFVGYSTQSRGYRLFNKRTRVIVETIHVNFDELPHMASDHVSSDPVPKYQRTALEHVSLSLGLQCQENVSHAAETITMSNELDLLFSLMFDELLNGSSQVVSKSSAVTTTDAPNHRQQQHTTSLNNQQTPDQTC
nr:hypothetical protein [Tanacetum cinerariifolium]